MTKKDFIAIADTLNLLFHYATGERDTAHFSDEVAQAITGAFVAMLLKQNSRFDSERFTARVYGKG